MSVLSHLSARINTLTAPDVRLDGEIECALPLLDHVQQRFVTRVGKVTKLYKSGNRWTDWAPRYTSEMDAVLRLIDTHLSGRAWRLHGPLTDEYGMPYYRASFGTSLHFNNHPGRALLAAALFELQESALP
jgi:hypothetical protein